jgi:hypothetical protein
MVTHALQALLQGMGQHRDILKAWLHIEAVEKNFFFGEKSETIHIFQTFH